MEMSSKHGALIYIEQTADTDRNILAIGLYSNKYYMQV